MENSSLIELRKKAELLRKEDEERKEKKKLQKEIFKLQHQKVFGFTDNMKSNVGGLLHKTNAVGKKKGKNFNAVMDFMAG